MSSQRTQDGHSDVAAADPLAHIEPAQSPSARSANGRAADRVVSQMLSTSAAVDPAAEEHLVHDAFFAAMTDLEKEGDRLAYRGPAAGAVNNLVGSVMMVPWALGANVNPPAGCQGQSILIESKLSHEKQLREWKFQKRSTYDPNDTKRLLPFSGYHWVVKATSPSGQTFLLDSNQGKFGAWGDLDKHFWYTE